MPVEMVPSGQFAQQQQSAMINKALRDILGFGLVMAGTGGAIRGARGLWNLGRRNLTDRKTPQLTSHMIDVPILEDEKEKQAEDEAGNWLTRAAQKYVTGPIAGAFKGNVSNEKNWPLYLPGMFAVGAGGLYGGYKGVDAILDARRKQQQEDELEEAKRRYEAVLMGKTSMAQDLDVLFDLYKQGKDQIPGGLADGKGDSAYPASEVAQGQKVEMEHTDDASKAKEIAKDHLEEHGGYYDALHEMEEDLEKDATGLNDTYGRAIGWGLALGLPISLVTGLATYDLTHKREPSVVLDKAKKKRRRQLAQRRPPAVYARPQVVANSGGASDVPNEDELDGEPLDKVAAINARLAKRGY